jgi:hypothetical protein
MARVLLRMPDALLKQIDAARASAEQAAGWPIDRTAFLLRLIREGLDRAGHRRPSRASVPQGGGELDAEDLGYDPQKYVLGKLCRQRHVWRDTGQSLLHKHNRTCAECHRSARRKKG